MNENAEIIQSIVGEEDLETLYGLLKKYQLDEPKLGKNKVNGQIVNDMIQYGVSLRLPLYYFWTPEAMVPHHKNRRLQVRGWGHISMEEFFEEKLARVALIKKTLLDHLTPNIPLKPR